MIMKKYIVLSLLAAFLIACEHEQVVSYSVQDRVYFKHGDNGKVDSMYVNLKEMNTVEFKEDSIVDIEISLLGGIADIDRPINVQLKDTVIADGKKYMAKKGVDFIIKQAFVAAGASKGIVQVQLLNSGKLKNNGDTLIAYLKLLENDMFLTDYNRQKGNRDKEIKNSTEFRVFYFSSINVPPRMWEEFYHESSRVGMKAYLGEYTPQKLEIFLAATGLSLASLEYTQEELDAQSDKEIYKKAERIFNSRFGGTKIFARWKALVQFYLQDNEDKYPEPIQWGVWWNTLHTPAIN
ncbi:hypothetical protein [Bacteroides congonensis]|uniref:hypothetical protein n=1 Tax=Bacteroides congonensis TaxID=1871006 RepID=UPI00189B05C8|nr:hypothetical protein [Bacteroides congonensis]